MCHIVKRVTGVVCRCWSVKRDGETEGGTHDVDELAELELDANGERVADVEHGPHKLVVVAQQVVVEPLRVRVPAAPCATHYCTLHPSPTRAASGPTVARDDATYLAVHGQAWNT